MRPFQSTISIDEARRRLDAAIVPIDETEVVRLADAAGRVAGADVTSTIDVPPFARSAMDGYALIAADTRRATRDTPARLRVVERVFTGRMPAPPPQFGSMRVPVCEFQQPLPGERFATMQGNRIPAEVTVGWTRLMSSPETDKWTDREPT